MAEQNGKVREFALDSISVQPTMQMREGVRDDVVEDYAEHVDDLPPVVVFEDGQTFWLSDGFHRYEAHRKAGRDRIRAEVRKGDRTEAIIYAMGCNTAHGLRRTNKDKRRAVQTALAINGAYRKGWTDREIAKLCGVSQPFVSSLSADYKLETAQVETDNGYQKRHGQEELSSDDNSSSRSGKNTSVAPDASSSEQSISDESDAEEAPSAACDEAGTPLPSQAVPAFEQLPELRSFCRSLDSAGKELERLGKSPVGVHVHWQSAQSSLKSARQTVWQGRPAFVCPACQGNRPGCKACRGNGFVTSAAYDQLKEANGEGGAK